MRNIVVKFKMHFNARKKPYWSERESVRSFFSAKIGNLCTWSERGDKEEIAARKIERIDHARTHTHMDSAHLISVFLFSDVNRGAAFIQPFIIHKKFVPPLLLRCTFQLREIVLMKITRLRSFVSTFHEWKGSA